MANFPIDRTSAIRWRSLDDQYLAHDCRTSGFDYLRIVLAVGVLVWHSYGLSYGRVSIDQVLTTSWLQPVIHSILPMFFALSGFLVTASLIRAKSLRTYLAFRGLRLFPALTVEVVLAAVILGPLVTSLSLIAYFSDVQFFRYFLNIVGLVQFRLPGVFEEVPYAHIVNGSLWTVPYELECYLYLVFFSLIGVFRNRFFILIAFLGASLVALQLGVNSTEGLVVYVKSLLVGDTDLQPNLQIATNTILHPNRIIVLCFLAGAVLYVWREHIPFTPILGLSAFALMMVLLSSPELLFFAPLPVAYFTIWLGLQHPPRLSLIDKGDYSYGIYLYSFPIQQLVSQSEIHGGSYLVHIIISLILSAIFAVFSWHFIEKPSLRLKRHFA